MDYNSPPYYRVWSPTYGQVEPDAALVLAADGAEASRLWLQRWDQEHRPRSAPVGEPVLVRVLAPGSIESRLYRVWSDTVIQYHAQVCG